MHDIIIIEQKKVDQIKSGFPIYLGYSVSFRK